MSRRKWNLGFLASHRGTNMQAIIDACNDGRIHARPAVVISNNGASGALDRARAEGIPAYHLGGRHFPDDASLDAAITEKLHKHEVDLVILAGYMKKVGPRLLSAYAGRVINVHPGLLPQFGGRGMYGMKVHEAVIAAGASETGVSIHAVDGEYDSGPVLAERRVPVRPDDTPESLAARVLPVEHATYVECVRRIVDGEIGLPAGGAAPNGRS